MKKTVGDILEVKGHEVAAVSPDDSVLHALEVMAEKNIGAVLVMDEQGMVHGVFSERDLARKLIIKSHSCENEKVGNIMTKKVIFVQLDTSIEQCMNMMTQNRIRHLPVLDNNRVVGIISIESSRNRPSNSASMREPALPARSSASKLAGLVPLLHFRA